MPAKVVTLEGLGAELKRIETDLGHATLRGLRVAAQGLRTEVIRQMAEVKPYQPVNTGALRQGWDVVNQPDGSIVQNLTPYATHMEFGTKPHWAPIAPLRIWAARKLKIPLRVAIDLNRGNLQRGQQGPRRRMKRNAQTRAVDALAFGAQRSIARHGTKGRFFWRAALEKLPAIVEKSIDRELRRKR